MREHTMRALRRFNEVIEQLRAPGGCPWDRQQTHQSLAPFLLEETYEVLDAIASGSQSALREELGDILLQVFLHSAIAAESRGTEADGFDLGDVVESVTTKMIHRHPHVFGDASVADPHEVVVNWERLKAQEKHERVSLLDGVPRTLPALAHAEAVQRRPARVGFDPAPMGEAAVADVAQRLAALPVTAGGKPSEPDLDDTWRATDGGFAREGEAVPGDPLGAASSELHHAFGELLFATVTLARRLQVDPEAALRQTSLEFADRFSRLEQAARADAVDLHQLGESEWRARWEAAANTAN